MIGGAEQYDVNATDYDFRSPLHVAAANGATDMVKFLLDHGAKQQLDRFGGLPVHDAMRQDHYEVVKLLRGAETALPEQGIKAKTAELTTQMDHVFRLIVQEGVFSFPMISAEVDYFYNHLGLDAKYFTLFNPAQVAKHVHSLIAAKKVAVIGRNPDDIFVELKDDKSQTVLCSEQNKERAEELITGFISEAKRAGQGFHVQSMESSSAAFPGSASQLSVYTITRDQFENAPDTLREGECDVVATATGHFLATKSNRQVRERRDRERGWGGDSGGDRGARAHARACVGVDVSRVVW